MFLRPFNQNTTRSAVYRKLTLLQKDMSRKNMHILANSFKNSFIRSKKECLIAPTRNNSTTTSGNFSKAENSGSLYATIGLVSVLCSAYYYYLENTSAKAFFGFGASSGSSKDGKGSSSPMSKSSGIKYAIEYADRPTRDFKTAFEQLKEYETESKTNLDLSWRLCRAAIDMGNSNDTDLKQSKMYHELAVEYGRQAIKINPWSSIAHLWLGSALSYANAYQSFYKRIINAAVIKGHFERAIEFNPMDPMAHHMLGMWYYTIADYNFFAKIFAFLLFNGGSILSTFNDALLKFEDSERIHPNFSIKNHLMLAKCYIRIGNYETARRWLDHVLKMPITSNQDQMIKKDASHLIQYLERQ